MKALTIRQPYAQLVADGRKPYETRSWPPPRGLIGERIAIHASKRFGMDEQESAEQFGLQHLETRRDRLHGAARGGAQDPRQVAHGRRAISGEQPAQDEPVSWR